MKPRATWLVIGLLALAGLYVGWRHFWFLCDDAFIEFRYVANSVAGYGYTWNRPPFLPVEGYTSFLWVLLLDAVWRLTGIAPPVAANPISLLFASATLGLGLLIMIRLPLAPRLERGRPLLVALSLLGILSNRTFLAWTSSGLETALFNCCFTAWISACVLLDPQTRRGATLIAATATAMALTRPDGLLACLATGLLLLYVRRPFSGWPMGATLLHILWRRKKYGAWLPNTYYAKYVAAWPESGVRYVASFILEYALWLWAIVFIASLIRPRVKEQPLKTHIGSFTAIAVVLGHFLYYTFIIGGDHFEYRVYSQLIVFIFVTLLWAVNRLGLGLRAAAATLTLLIACSLPVPWIHWRATHFLPRLSNTWRLRKPVAPHLPAFLRWYGRWFDERQFWLIGHYVCMRHEEHRNFLYSREDLMVPRAIGSATSAEGFPIWQGVAVGYPGWVMPNVAVLDLVGLNDWVIARAPVLAARERTMAHDRSAPAGYVDCLQPNVTIDKMAVHVAPRVTPLTAETIRMCEQSFRQKKP